MAIIEHKIALAERNLQHKDRSGQQFYFDDENKYLHHTVAVREYAPVIQQSRLPARQVQTRSVPPPERPLEAVS